MATSPINSSKIFQNLVAGGVGAAVALSGAYLVAPSEGLVLGTYKDPVGIITSCYGHVDKTLKLNQRFTQEQCDKTLAQDLIKHDAELAKLVKVPYRSVYQHAALLSFTYNVGPGNVKSSTLLRKFNADDHDGACLELNKWVFARNGNNVLAKLPGLVIRRTNEYKWCTGQVPLEISYNIDTKKTTGVKVD